MNLVDPRRPTTKVRLEGIELIRKQLNLSQPTKNIRLEGIGLMRKELDQNAKNEPLAVNVKDAGTSRKSPKEERKKLPNVVDEKPSDKVGELKKQQDAGTSRKSPKEEGKKLPNVVDEKPSVKVGELKKQQDGGKKQKSRESPQKSQKTKNQKPVGEKHGGKEQGSRERPQKDLPTGTGDASESQKTKNQKPDGEKPCIISACFQAICRCILWILCLTPSSTKK